MLIFIVHIVPLHYKLWYYKWNHKFKFDQYNLLITQNWCDYIYFYGNNGGVKWSLGHNELSVNIALTMLTTHQLSHDTQQSVLSSDVNLAEGVNAGCTEEKIPEEGHGTSLPPRCWDPGHLRGAAADDDTDRTARGVRRLREEAVAPEPELPPWNLERLPKEHPDQQRPGGMAPPPEPCRSHIEAALLPAAGAPEARGNEHWHHCEAGVRPQSEQNPTGCLQDNDQQAHHKLGPACERDAVSDVTTEAVRLLRAVLNVRHQTRALLRAHTLSKEIISGLLSTLALLRAHTLSKDLAYIIKNKDNKKSHNMIRAQFIYYLKYHNYNIMITLSHTTT